MRTGMEEKQMRDVKEQIRVNEIRDAKSLKSRYKELDEGNGIRDAKGKNKEGDSLVFCSSLLVYPNPVSAFKLFASRLLASRICSFDHNFYLFPLGFFHIAPTYWVTPCQSWQLSN
ncbi:hypothetical protein BCT55_21780 [Vibrio splendidus]|uniref:hypothetical protein n=1 Tax=Vibrio splendidus TaxID=29497 RepID=UPI000C863324|nr:hypothetical protein [Vibrio splendidus]MDH5905117.1 hypothetical protein [Vibrio splendidus]PMM32597.1 hypothetical protein BCT55_21780 [Vibrio splendidus]